MTTTVGRETGVADGRETGVADGEGDGKGDGVAETFATEGVAETDATSGEAMVVGTGFTLPASKAEAVALGDAPGACP